MPQRPLPDSSTRLPAAMNPAPPDSEELDALLRLLDDDTPLVRERVAARIARSGGDLSAWLATHPRALTPQEQSLLAAMLRPPRRDTLTRTWFAHTPDASAPHDAWDMLERRLGALSDFLHDGITPRPSLATALDRLAHEAAASGVTDEMALRRFLFESKRLTGNQDAYHDPRNSDLAWSIAAGRSNPIGLCLIYMLVARRMQLRVEGVNFPGHFLCRIYQDGYPLVIDCFDGGQLHLQATLLEEESDLSRQQRAQLRQTADPHTILVRILNNLASAMQQVGRDDDAALIERLLAPLAK